MYSEDLFYTLFLPVQIYHYLSEISTCPKQMLPIQMMGGRTSR